MDFTQPGLLIFVPIFLLLIFGLIVYFARTRGSDRRSKPFLAGLTVVFVLVLATLVPFLASSWFGGFNAHEPVPPAVIPFLFLLPVAFILLGVCLILFADDAVALYARRRDQGSTGKWAVPTLPQRQSFIVRGAVAIGLGIFMLGMFVYSLTVGF